MLSMSNSTFKRFVLSCHFLATHILSEVVRLDDDCPARSGENKRRSWPEKASFFFFFCIALSSS